MYPSDVQAWLEKLDERRRHQAEDLAKIVLAADPKLEQAIKWNRLTFTLGGDWHHWLCGIAAPAKGPKLIFHKGALLDDPDALLAGSAAYVREVPADDAIRHPAAIGSLIREAISHQHDMLD